MLNHYFCRQSTLPDEQNQSLPIKPNATSILSEIVISPQDVTDAIAAVHPSKASGPDLVSPRLLREGAHFLAAPLSTFFTQLIRQSVFPSAWKLANVTPIFKNRDPYNPANYRPMSLLSCPGKLMERCIHKVLYNYLVSKYLLSSKVTLPSANLHAYSMTWDANTNSILTRHVTTLSLYW